MKYLSLDAMIAMDKGIPGGSFLLTLMAIRELALLHGLNTAETPPHGILTIIIERMRKEGKA